MQKKRRNPQKLVCLRKEHGEGKKETPYFEWSDVRHRDGPLAGQTEQELAL